MTHNSTATSIARDYLRAYGFRRAYGVARLEGADEAVCRRICSLVKSWRNTGRKGW